MTISKRFRVFKLSLAKNAIFQFLYSRKKHYLIHSNLNCKELNREKLILSSQERII